MMPIRVNSDWSLWGASEVLLRYVPPAHYRRSCPLPDGERAALFCNMKEWVRGFGSIGLAGNPLTPTLSPTGERERTEPV
jgi:hypothetical protein